MLSPREIIAEAWALTQETPVLKYWGFAGSFFEILLDSKLLLTQAYFLYSYIQGTNAGLFDIEIALYNNLPGPLFWSLAVFFIILIIVEIFFPSFSTGAIIGLSAKAHKKEPLTGGFICALYNFFPILATHEIFIFSSLSILITAVSLILRYGGNMAMLMITVSAIIWVVSNIVKFFSTFIEPGIVIEKLGVFEAGTKSVKLMFSYLPHVTFLFLLLFVISIRILINTIIIILIPALLMGLGLLLINYISFSMMILVSTIVGILTTLLAAYFFAYLHIFKQAVWTILYIELLKEKELDDI